MVFWLPVVVLLFFLLLLLCLTTRLRVNAANSESESRFVVELGFIFSVFLLRYRQMAARKSIHLGIGRWAIIKFNLKKSTPAKKKPKSVKPKPKLTLSQRFKKLTGLLHWRWRELKSELVYLLRSFRQPQLNGQVRIGLGNPMQTGLLFGLYSLVTGIWPGIGHRFNLQPIFTRAKSSWDINFRVEFVPARLLWRGIKIWKILRQRR